MGLEVEDQHEYSLMPLFQIRKVDGYICLRLLDRSVSEYSHMDGEFVGSLEWGCLAALGWEVET